jgi:hypothetical protein
MNKEYLKENNLYEAHKQFMRLCEWSFVSKNVMEDDDEEQDAMGGDMNQEDPMAGGQDPMMGDDMSQDPSMGGEDPMANGDDDQMGGDMNQEDPMAGGQDPMMGGEEPMDGGMDDPMMGGEDPMMGGEDEEVIDVDDLTDAQEKMNSKVNVVGRNLGDVDDKIEALMQSLSNMEQMINNNNAEIAAFKQEFEKRNPTQTEKLNLRSLDSYPFNVNPKEYWSEKGIDPTSNYEAEGDNDKSTTQEYVITNNDVDKFDNKTVEDSFNIDDDMNQTIQKIFGLK